MFRAHVGRRAHPVAALREFFGVLVAVDDFGDAKIEDLDVELVAVGRIFAQTDIGWLEVPMDDVFAVRFGESVEDLKHDGLDFIKGEFLASCDVFVECFSIQEFHGIEKRLSAVGVDRRTVVKNFDDVFALNARAQIDFALKAFGGDVVIVQRVAQRFDGDGAIVARVDGRIDDPESTGSRQCDSVRGAGIQAANGRA